MRVSSQWKKEIPDNCKWLEYYTEIAAFSFAKGILWFNQIFYGKDNIMKVFVEKVLSPGELVRGKLDLHCVLKSTARHRNGLAKDRTFNCLTIDANASIETT